MFAGADGFWERVLPYWLDVECLKMPSLPKEARSFGKETVKWNQFCSSEHVTENTLYFGVFNSAAATVALAADLEIQQRPEDEEKPWQPRRASSNAPNTFLASISISPDGKYQAESLVFPFFTMRRNNVRQEFSLEDITKRIDDVKTAFRQHFFPEHAPDLEADARTSYRMNDWLDKELSVTPHKRAGGFRFYQSRRPRKNDPVTLPEGSFFIADIMRAHDSFRKKVELPVLKQYLSGAELHDSERLDADVHAVIASALELNKYPDGKWPGRGVKGFPLVLRQQMAVNQAVKGKSPLVAVNGPPGTGKTTLLRDVIGAAIVQRAHVMARYTDPMKAFTEEVSISIEGLRKPKKGWKIAADLCGHGILVASSNNNAVKNISSELPLKASLADSYAKDPAKLSRLAFFPDISDRLISGGEPKTWGNISASLGNSDNRKAFLEVFWPKEKVEKTTTHSPITALTEPSQRSERTPMVFDAVMNGQRTTLKFWVNRYSQPILEAILNSCASKEEVAVDLEPGKNGDLFIKGLHVENEREEYFGLADLLSNTPDTWQAALGRFKVATAEVEHLRSLLAAIKDEETDVASCKALLKALDKPPAASTLDALKIECEAARSEMETASQAVQVSEKALADIEARKPGFWKTLLSGVTEWEQELAAAKVSIETLQSSRTVKENAHKGLTRSYESLLAQVKSHAAQCRGIHVRIGQIEGKAATARRILKEVPMPLGDASDASAFEQSAPGITEQFDLAREELFIAAIELHKAFLKAAAKPVTANMNLFSMMLKNENRKVISAHLGADLWNTFFLTTPVISSTFASVGSMFGDDMRENSLGWALLDESGQSVPQAAAGTLWRARRAIVVGDPKQVEPVCESETGLTALLARSNKVSISDFDPNIGSAQTLSDRRSALGAYLGEGEDRIWVGCPLRVHRRSSDPMFSISNRISYANTMVLGKRPFSTDGWVGEIPEYGPGGQPSCWFDTPPNVDPANKVDVIQTNIVVNMLVRMAEQYTLAEKLMDGKGKPQLANYICDNGMPNVFVISAFKAVAEAVQDAVVAAIPRFIKANAALTPAIVTKWAKGEGNTKSDRIGTVHAFQGKEAPTVIMALGGGADTLGAVNWAGKTANILNVAATRAKESFYIVGNHKLWSQTPPFLSATNGNGPQLPVIELPEFMGTVHDPERITRLDSLAEHLEILKKAFEEAKTCVRVSSPYMTAAATDFEGLPIIPLIESAVKRGVEVIIYNDPSMSSSLKQNEILAVRKRMTDAGANFPSVSKVHAKTLIVDETQIVEGSFNWLSSVRGATQFRYHESSFVYTGSDISDVIRNAIEKIEGTAKVTPIKKTEAKPAANDVVPQNFVRPRPQQFRKLTLSPRPKTSPKT